MKHRHQHGSDRHSTRPEGSDDRVAHGGHQPHQRRHGGGHGRRRGSRAFDYGELRLLALKMIAEQPRHGYELMKEIGERTGGSYSPSPGVIYPTLSWLDDMGYVTLQAGDGGRKRYGITAEGQAFLAANGPAVDALLSRIHPRGAGGEHRVPEPVIEGMENLKRALRLRLQRGPIDQAAADGIAAALGAAAEAVEHS